MDRDIDKELKSFLDESLSEHFNKFLEVKVKNLTLNVMPIQKDVPVITTAAYDKELDYLEIILNNYTNLTERTFKNVTILFTDDNVLAGVRLYEFKNFVFSQIKSLVIEKLREDRHNNPFPIVNFRKKEIEKRKYSFFSDVLGSSRIEKMATN
jgi:hypothetical protein